MDLPINPSVPETVKPTAVPGDPKPNIKFEDFLKLDLRIGVVEKAEPHPNPKAKKLIVLSVNFGELGFRTICAGVKEHYPDPSWMVGQPFIFCVNLDKRTLMDVPSEGMILAAANDAHNILGVATIDMITGKDGKIAHIETSSLGGWKVG